MSGLSYSTVNSILRGKSETPNLGTIIKIASAFSMTIIEFLDVPEIVEYSFDDMEEIDEDNALNVENSLWEIMPKVISTLYTEIIIIICCAWPTDPLRIIMSPKTW